ncbi:MAG: hypothetical protein CR975_02365 [Gammaproteobacteria bacterium]|nr:MAG: hypothetical protein CR975_02365 [Gammaproteobacteria bacterium]
MNDHSQVMRLPKAFYFDCDKVCIHRDKKQRCNFIKKHILGAMCYTAAIIKAIHYNEKLISDTTD